MPQSSRPIHSAVSENHFDYIITGAGAAGLSLLTRMIASGKFSDKRILLIDKQSKTNNDRTWCFWENGEGFFEDIVFRSWPSLSIFNTGFAKHFDIAPYRYKMIRGIDFYDHCFKLIATQKNITILYGSVQDVNSDEKKTSVTIDDKKLTADYIFNSILFKKPILLKKEFYLLQHFKGWIIETEDAIFNEDNATLMDFRVVQEKGTAFVYVMPFSTTKALVEFTMFSERLLEQPGYDENLREYISACITRNSYRIVDEETGVIPMTSYRFPVSDHHIINMGTAGGQTKASTGYTFMPVQKHTAGIVDALAAGNNPANVRGTSGRYHFYDSVLLNVLATGKLPGDKVFTRLFARNHPHQIFGFLDNKSSLLQDLKLISSLPTMPFLKAGIEELIPGF